MKTRNIILGMLLFAFSACTPENKSVTIYNISGKLCFQNKNTTTIDFSAQNRVYYIVRIKDMKVNTIISKIMY